MLGINLLYIKVHEYKLHIKSNSHIKVHDQTICVGPRWLIKYFLKWCSIFFYFNIDLFIFKYFFFNKEEKVFDLKYLNLWHDILSQR